MGALTPRAEKKFFSGPNLQGKVQVVSAPPGRECTLQGRTRVNFRKLGRCGRLERLFS